MIFIRCKGKYVMKMFDKIIRFIDKKIGLKPNTFGYKFLEKTHKQSESIQQKLEEDVKGIKNIKILQEIFKTVVVAFCTLLITSVIRNIVNPEMDYKEKENYFKEAVSEKFSQCDLNGGSVSINQIKSMYLNDLDELDKPPSLIACGTYTCENGNYIFVCVFEKESPNLIQNFVGIENNYKLSFFSRSEEIFATNIEFKGDREFELSNNNLLNIIFGYELYYADRREEICLILDEQYDDWKLVGFEDALLSDKVNDINNSDVQLLYDNYIFIDSESNETNVLGTAGNIWFSENIIYGGMDIGYTIPAISGGDGILHPSQKATIVLRYSGRNLVYDPNWNGGKVLLYSSSLSEEEELILIEEKWGARIGDILFYGEDVPK